MAILHGQAHVNPILGEHLQQSVGNLIWALLNDKETGVIFPSGEPYLSRLIDEVQALNTQIPDAELHCGISAPVIRHYNEGWADGYHYGIKYWEIWNEPDNGDPGHNQMWMGTAEQFYELYDVAAKHLKACFGDSIKVGGYGCSGLYGLYYHPEKCGINVKKRDPDERYVKDTYRIEFFNGFWIIFKRTVLLSTFSRITVMPMQKKPL